MCLVDTQAEVVRARRSRAPISVESILRGRRFRRVQGRILFIALVTLTSCIRAGSPAPPPDQEILASLAAQPSLPLPDDPAKGCVIADIHTVADYYAWLLRTLRESTAGDRGLTVTCTPLPEGAFDCLVMAYVDNGEPWSYGLRFSLQRGRAIAPSSLSCPGTP